MHAASRRPGQLRNWTRLQRPSRGNRRWRDLSRWNSAASLKPRLRNKLSQGEQMSNVLNKLFEEDGAIVFREACRLGCEGIVSKRLGSPYRSGRSGHWVKVKNPKAPAVKREAEEDWGR
jgi:hypothetical protein